MSLNRRLAAIDTFHLLAFAIVAGLFTLLNGFSLFCSEAVMPGGWSLVLLLKPWNLGPSEDLETEDPWYLGL